MSDEHDIILPVTEQNIRFKAPARFGDVLRLTTWVKSNSPKLFFHQEIRHLHNDKLIIEARTETVLINAQGKMYRRFPDIFQDKLRDL